MSPEDINKMLEIASEPGHTEKCERISSWAIISCITALLLIPFTVGSSLIFEHIIHNEYTGELNGFLCYSILFLTPASILSGIIALIHIPLSNNKLKGRGLAVIGMILSAGSFLAMAYFCLSNLKLG
jgi:hypothetical protein